MAKKYDQLTPNHHKFLARQHLFFTASAPNKGRVNVSPRSTDLFRILNNNSVMYLDRTGSGNETSAHIKENGRLTIMFCSVEGPPLIMRLYGTGRTVQRGSKEYSDFLASQYANEEPVGARQMILLDVDLVQTSCGFGVPMFDYKEERTQMDSWANAKGPDGIEAYWRDENQESLDGQPTGLFD